MLLFPRSPAKPGGGVPGGHPKGTAERGPRAVSDRGGNGTHGTVGMGEQVRGEEHPEVGEEVTWVHSRLAREVPADTHGGVGGDWFDVIALSDHRVALVLGDVFGHGIDAAVTMGRLRAMVRALSKLEVPPDELLRLLDELAVDIARDRDDGSSVRMTVGATCLYAVYDATSRRCVMSSAGHPPPALISPDGSVGFADVPPGAPIGVGHGSYESVEVELEEGSVVGLYSDGLIEGIDHDIDRGMHKLRTVLARPAAALDDLCAWAVDALAPDGPVDLCPHALRLAREGARVVLAARGQQAGVATTSSPPPPWAPVITEPRSRSTVA